MSGEAEQREVVVRPVASGDRWWLVRAGLSPELVGRQYHWAELPLQAFIAPARPTGLRSGPRCVIEVDGRRAGYIGRNPLSGNLEYFLAPWARGGVGRHAIVAFLRDHRDGDRSRAFFVSHENERSLAALRAAIGELGWIEGTDVWTTTHRNGIRLHVRAEPPRGPDRPNG